MNQRGTKPLKVAYLTQNHPMTILLDETQALHQAGVNVDIYSLDGLYLTKLQTQQIQSVAQTTYYWDKPPTQLSMIWANLALLTTVGLRRYQAAYTFAKASESFSSFKAFMQLVNHAYTLKVSGITHFHALFAAETATLALIFSWLTSVPFSFTAYDYDIFTKNSQLKQKIQAAKFIVTPSTYNKKYLIDRFGSNEAKLELDQKIRVIQPLVNLSQLPLRPYPPKQDALSILACGSLKTHKGYLYLVEACRILQERQLPFACQIIGHGPTQADLQAAIGAYGLYNSVKLLNSVPYQTRLSLLRQTTVLVLPSVIAHDGNRDGLPRILMEALASGVPVVASDIVGFRELIGHQAGCLVPPHNPEALADALQEIYLAGPAYQQAVGQAGRQFAETHLDASRNINQLATLFRHFQ